MKNNIKLSIVTPVYNRMDSIENCLNSVLCQDYYNYEHIIVNDGSTDDTIKKINLICSNNQKFKIITYTENKGVNYARNRGIEVAEGEYILFLDSDDQLYPGSLSEVYKSINLYPNYKHYLFQVSDRLNDKILSKTPDEFTFEDWLTEKISGDFVHVIQPECFKENMFLEEFRIYEILNWLRIMRKYSIQLFIPIPVAIIDRNRLDSVTKETILSNEFARKNNYRFIFQYIEWFKSDLEKNKRYDILQKSLIKGILIGVSLKYFKQNKVLITQLNTFNKYQALLFRFINRFPFDHVITILIYFKSKYNNR
jgi:glycosyltransferase involved in cell wall biosynthesis